MIRIDEPNTQIYYLEMFDIEYYNSLNIDLSDCKLYDIPTFIG